MADRYAIITDFIIINLEVFLFDSKSRFVIFHNQLYLGTISMTLASNVFVVISQFSSHSYCGHFSYTIPFIGTPQGVMIWD